MTQADIQDLDAAVAKFAVDGFVVYRGLLKGKETQKLLTELRGLIAMAVEAGRYSTSGEHHLPTIPGGLTLSRLLLTSGSPSVAAVIERLGHKGKLMEVITRVNVDPTAQGSWHQDHPFHQGQNGLTIWIPLTPCGVDAPGLQFLVPKEPGIGRLTQLLKKDATGLTPTNQAELFRSYKAYAPAYEVGDCAIFNGFIPHCTHQTEGMKETRTSIEVRVS